MKNFLIAMLALALAALVIAELADASQSAVANIISRESA